MGTLHASQSSEPSFFPAEARLSARALESSEDPWDTLPTGTAGRETLPWARVQQPPPTAGGMHWEALFNCVAQESQVLVESQLFLPGSWASVISKGPFLMNSGMSTGP